MALALTALALLGIAMRRFARTVYRERPPPNRSTIVSSAPPFATLSEAAFAYTRNTSIAQLTPQDHKCSAAADRPTLNDDLLLESMRPLLLAGAQDVGLADYRAAVELLFSVLRESGWSFHCASAPIRPSDEPTNLPNKNNTSLEDREALHRHDKV